MAAHLLRQLLEHLGLSFVIEKMTVNDAEVESFRVSDRCQAGFIVLHSLNTPNADIAVGRLRAYGFIP